MEYDISSLINPPVKIAFEEICDANNHYKFYLPRIEGYFISIRNALAKPHSNTNALFEQKDQILKLYRNFVCDFLKLLVSSEITPDSYVAHVHQLDDDRTQLLDYYEGLKAYKHMGELVMYEELMQFFFHVGNSCAAYLRNNFFVDVCEPIINYVFSTTDASYHINNFIRDYKPEEMWFVLGIYLATGKIDQYVKSGLVTSLIAERLYPTRKKSAITYLNQTGISKFRDSTSNLNIFRKEENIVHVYNYCLENKLPMTEVFKNLYLKKGV